MFKIDKQTLKDKLSQIKPTTPEEARQQYPGIEETKHWGKISDPAQLRAMSSNQWKYIHQGWQQARKNIEEGKMAEKELQDIVDPEFSHIFNDLHRVGSQSCYDKFSIAGKQIHDLLLQPSPPPIINLVIGNENINIVSAFLHATLCTPYTSQGSDVNYAWQPPEQTLLKSMKGTMRNPINYRVTDSSEEHMAELNRLIFGIDFNAGNAPMTMDGLSRSAISYDMLADTVDVQERYKKLKISTGAYNVSDYPTFLTARIIGMDELPATKKDTTNLTKEFEKRPEYKKTLYKMQRIMEMFFTPLWFKLLPARGQGLTLELLQKHIMQYNHYEHPAQIFEGLRNNVGLPKPSTEPYVKAENESLNKTAVVSPISQFEESQEEGQSAGSQLPGLLVIGSYQVGEGDSIKTLPIYSAITPDKSMQYGLHLMEIFHALIQDTSALDTIYDNLAWNGFVNDNSVSDDTVVVNERGEPVFESKTGESRIAAKCFTVDASGDICLRVKDTDALPMPAANLLKKFRNITETARKEIIAPTEKSPMSTSFKRTMIVITKNPMANPKDIAQDTKTQGYEYIDIDPNWVVHLDIVTEDTSEKYLLENFIKKGKNIPLALKDTSGNTYGITDEKAWNYHKKQSSSFKEFLKAMASFPTMYSLMKTINQVISDKGNPNFWTKIPVGKDKEGKPMEEDFLDVEKTIRYLRDEQFNIRKTEITGLNSKSAIQIFSPLIYRDVAERTPDRAFLDEEYIKELTKIDYMPSDANQRAQLKHFESMSKSRDQLMKAIGSVDISDGRKIIENLEKSIAELKTKNIEIDIKDILGMSNEDFIETYKKTNKKDRMIMVEKVKLKLKDKIPHLMLMWGPPGTGKTHYGRMLGGVFGPDYKIANVEFSTQKGFGYLGQMEHATQQILDMIRNATKTVFIFDESEELLSEDGQSHEASKDRAALLKKFLSEEFAPKDREGLGEKNQTYILVTTNHYGRLGSAALARFEERIFLNYETELPVIQNLTVKSIMIFEGAYKLEETGKSKEEIEKLRVQMKPEEFSKFVEEQLVKLSPADRAKNIFYIGVNPNLSGKMVNATRAISWAFYEEANAQPNGRPYANREIIDFITRWFKKAGDVPRVLTDYVGSIVESVHKTDPKGRETRWQNIKQTMKEKQKDISQIKLDTFEPQIFSKAPDSPDTINQMNVPKTIGEAQSRIQPSQSTRKTQIEELADRPEPVVATPPKPGLVSGPETPEIETQPALPGAEKAEGFGQQPVQQKPAKPAGLPKKEQLKQGIG